MSTNCVRPAGDRGERAGSTGRVPPTSPTGPSQFLVLAPRRPTAAPSESCGGLSALVPGQLAAESGRGTEDEGCLHDQDGGKRDQRCLVQPAGLAVAPPGRRARATDRQLPLDGGEPIRRSSGHRLFRSRTRGTGGPLGFTVCCPMPTRSPCGPVATRWTATSSWQPGCSPVTSSGVTTGARRDRARRLSSEPSHRRRPVGLDAPRPRYPTVASHYSR